MSNLTTKPNVCPDCKNTFFQPFVCTTCGAQRLYDETVRSQQATIDRLTARIAELEAALRDLLSYVSYIDAKGVDATARKLLGKYENLGL